MELVDRLFDDVPRTDATVAGYAERRFPFLNRVRGPYWDDVRFMLETWYAHMPSDHRRDVRGRVRSGDDRDFDAAFWELYLHEAMLGCGYTVQCHPEVAGTRRPDFLVDTGAGRFYLEARTIARSKDEHGEKKRLDVVYDAINRLECPGHLLRIEVEAVGPNDLSLRRFAPAAQQWLDSLAQRPPALDELAFWETEPWEWKEADWRFRLWAMRRTEKTLGLATPNLAMLGSSRGSEINDARPLRKALSEKGKAYGDLPDPFVIALNISTIGDDTFAIANSLYGTWKIEFSTSANGTVTTRDVRAPDGYWYAGTHWKHDSVSAVLLGQNLVIWNAARVSPTCWLHPDPATPLAPPPAWRIAALRNDEMTFTEPKLAPHEALRLPQDWLTGPAFED